MRPQAVCKTSVLRSKACRRRTALRDATFFRHPRTLDPSWVPDYLNRRNLYPQPGYNGIGYSPAPGPACWNHLRGRDPADLVRAGRGQTLRHAIATARPLATAVADHRIAQAGGLGHLQRRFAVLDHVLNNDLTRVPADRLSPYLAHLTERLGLDNQDVTVAALDRLAPSRSPDGMSDDVVEGFSAPIHASECFPTSGEHRDPSSASTPSHLQAESGQEHDPGRE